MKKQTLEERLELYVADKVSKNASPNALLLAASAVVGVGAILVPPPAEAAIVYSGEGQNLKVSAGSSPQKIDFDGDGNAEFTFQLTSSSPYFYSQQLAAVGTASVIKGDNDNPALLAGNYTVSSQKSFSAAKGAELVLASFSENTSVSGSFTTNGNFVDKQGFLGVKFEIGSNTHYGWIQYETNEKASVGTIIDWAYEDTPDKAIKAGATVSRDDDFDWNLFLPAILAGAKK